MTRIRILAASPCYVPGPGGAEISLHETLSRLVRKGFLARIVTLADHPLLGTFPELPACEMHDGVWIERCPADRYLDYLGRRAKKSDVIVYQQRFAFSNSGLDLEAVLAPHREKTVYFVRSDPVFDISAAPLLVANSRWAHERLAEAGRETLLLHPPVATPRVSPTAHRRNHVTLVNPTIRKGGELFLELARSFPIVPFLAQLGWGSPVQGLSLVPNVTVHPPTRDMALVYGETLILLVPSVTEPLGRVAIEGALAGCLVMAHATQGLAELPLPPACFLSSLDVQAWRERLAVWLAAGRKTQEKLREDILESAAAYRSEIDEISSELQRRFRSLRQ